MYKLVNGKRVPVSPEDIADAKVLKANFEEEVRLNGYKARRMNEYPSVGDQMDTIYHKGVDAWKAEIKAIKDKYPKPTE